MYVTWVSSRIFFCGGRSYIGITAEGFSNSHLKLVNAYIDFKEERNECEWASCTFIYFTCCVSVSPVCLAIASYLFITLHRLCIMQNV